MDPGVIKSCWQADLASLFHKWIQRAARMPYSLSVSGVGVGVLQPSASCLGTCGVGSLGAGFSTVQVIRLGMFCFFFFFQGNYYLSQMISGYRNSTLLQSLLFSALYWSICEVFWGQQGQQCEFNDRSLHWFLCLGAKLSCDMLVTAELCSVLGKKIAQSFHVPVLFKVQ